MTLVRPSALWQDQMQAYVALCRGCAHGNEPCPHRWVEDREEQCVEAAGPKPACIHRRKTTRRERRG